jgi:hypothetical protein
MSARLIDEETNRWEVIDGPRRHQIWIDEFGVRVKEVGHQVETASFSEVIDLAQKQERIL